MNRTKKIIAATCLSLSASCLIAVGARAQDTQIKLMAMPNKTSEGTGEVRLLWTVTQGWLPDAGVYIYRSDKPDAPLNAKPIRLDARLLSQTGAQKIAGPVKANRALFGAGVMKAGNIAPASSLAAFQAFKQEAVRLQGMPGVRASQIAAQAANVDPVKNYRSHLKPLVPAAGVPAPAPATDEDKTVSTRIQVLLAALSNYEAAQKLGLAFIDKSPADKPSTGVLRETASGKITYTLRAADAARTVLATASVPTGDATQLPSPTQLDAVQIGGTSVALHWEPVTPAQEKALVGETYNVYRGGAKVNTSPVRIAFLPTTDPVAGDGHVAPMASFIDSNAPQAGSVAYTVTLTDAFGRVSAPAATTMTMTDLRVPDPVGKVYAFTSRRTPGAIRLYWEGSDNGGDIPVAVNTATSTITITPIAYDVYRTQAGQTETTVTQSGPVRFTGLQGVTPPGALFSWTAQGPPPTRVPTEFLDLTLADLLVMVPDYKGQLIGSIQLSGIPAVLTNAQFQSVLNQPLDQLYALLGTVGGPLSEAQQQNYLLQVLEPYQTYLDTTPTIDKDYIYRIAPCYTINATHHGTASRSSSVAVPTADAPPTPAGLGGTFKQGPGAFGFVNDGSIPTLRLQAGQGALVEQSHFKAPTVTHTPGTLSGTTAGAKTNAAGLTGSAKQNAANTVIATGPGTRAPQSPLLTPPAVVNPKYVISTAEKAPPMAIAGNVTLTWQAAPFSSPVHYRIYRAVATGLFPAVPTTTNIGIVGKGTKFGMPPSGTFATLAAKRGKVAVKYYVDYPAVPDANYGLLTETTKLQYVDRIPVSQRMHYNYRIVPVTRWGVTGPETPITDVFIPATLPPSVPTLLKAQVDEGIGDGHVRLSMTTNPTDENVTSYSIFRKPVATAIQTAGKKGAMLQSQPVRVATRRGGYAPPVTTLKLPTAKNLNLTAIKANNNLLLQQILAPDDYVKVGDVPATGPLTFTDTSGVPRVPYVYEVVAVNGDKISSKPSSPLDATALKVHCDPPTVSTPVLNATGDTPTVTLNWQAPPTEPSVSYVLERSVTPLPVASGQMPTDFITIANTTATSYVDTNVRSGRRYTYRLRAVDSEGLFSVAPPPTPSLPASLPPLPMVDYPALAAVDFGDPAPIKSTPTTLNPATNPVGPTTRPNNPGIIAETPTVTPGAPTPGGKMATPSAPTGAAHFASSYFVTGDDVFAVQIVKASYQVAGYAIDAQNFYYTHPTEKFLLLTMLVKNTTSQPQAFDYQTITAGGKTADGDDLAQTKNWKALDTGTLANRTVAPGATFTIEGVVTVPANGDPKTLSFGDLTFDLGDAANAIAPLPASLGGGNSAPAEAPAVADGTFYSLAFTEGAVSMTRLPTGFGVALTVRNATKKALSVSNANYTVELYDEDGDKYPVNPSNDAPVSIAPGATTTLHFAFDAPAAIKLQSLKVRERDGRIYVFPVGAK